jgi:hypothetical protein
VGAEEFREVGRGGDGPCLVRRAVLRAPFLPGGAVVDPAPSGAGRGGGHYDPAPSLLRQVQVGLAEHDRLRRPQRGVIRAGGGRAGRTIPAEPGQADSGLADGDAESGVAQAAAYTGQGDADGATPASSYRGSPERPGLPGSRSAAGTARDAR